MAKIVVLVGFESLGLGVACRLPSNGTRTGACGICSKQGVVSTSNTMNDIRDPWWGWHFFSPKKVGLYVNPGFFIKP